MLKVQKIACTNDAAFVMKFWVGYQDDNNQEHGTSDTGDYPVGQTRVIDLASHNLPADTLIWPSVAAVFGKQENGKTKLLYSPNGQTATFAVRGTTLNYSVDLIS